MAASFSASVFGFGGALVTAGFFASTFFGGVLVLTVTGGLLVSTGLGIGFFSGFGSGLGFGFSDFISGAGSGSASGSEAGAGAGAGPPVRSKKSMLFGFGVHPRKVDRKMASRMMSPCAMETRPNTFFIREFFTGLKRRLFSPCHQPHGFDLGVFQNLDHFHNLAVVDFFIGPHINRDLGISRADRLHFFFQPLHGNRRPIQR